MEDEKLRLNNKARKVIFDVLYREASYNQGLIADGILYGLERLGYLPVEPVQLEVIRDEEMKGVIRDNLGLLNDERRAVELLFIVSQATITLNERLGKLYRRVE